MRMHDEAPSGKILLAADEFYGQLLSKILLNKFDIPVRVVGVDEDVIPAVRSDKFSLIILTHSGVPCEKIPDTVSAIREIDKETPVLVVSGIHWDEYVEELKRRGANSFIREPLEVDDLVSGVQCWMEPSNGEPDIVKKKIHTCPKCGSVKFLLIVYGWMDSAPVGLDIYYGGCCVSDDSPKWHCMNCGNEWGKSFLT